MNGLLAARPVARTAPRRRRGLARILLLGALACTSACWFGGDDGEPRGPLEPTDLTPGYEQLLDRCELTRADVLAEFFGDSIELQLEADLEQLEVLFTAARAEQFKGPQDAYKKQAAELESLLLSARSLTRLEAEAIDLRAQRRRLFAESWWPELGLETQAFESANLAYREAVKSNLGGGDNTEAVSQLQAAVHAQKQQLPVLRALQRAAERGSLLTRRLEALDDEAWFVGSRPLASQLPTDILEQIRSAPKAALHSLEQLEQSRTASLARLAELPLALERADRLQRIGAHQDPAIRMASSRVAAAWIGRLGAALDPAQPAAKAPRRADLEPLCEALSSAVDAHSIDLADALSDLDLTRSLCSPLEGYDALRRDLEQRAWLGPAGWRITTAGGLGFGSCARTVVDPSSGLSFVLIGLVSTDKLDALRADPLGARLKRSDLGELEHDPIALYLAETEVDIASWQHYCAALGVPEAPACHTALTWTPEAGWLRSGPATSADPLPGLELELRPDCPATQLCWTCATDYCEAFGYELPPEALWAYASRGGARPSIQLALDPKTNMADQSLAREAACEAPFSFDDGFAYLAPAGALEANPLGLRGMLGNVWEWCAARPAHAGASGGSLVPARYPLRGGSWLDGRTPLADGSRSWGADFEVTAALDVSGPNVGFRPLFAIPLDQLRAQ